ncbi:glutathione S-transferase family protein [Leptospira gomenensis]|uniref:Glutathione S-transferase family protein n=2 Tax=Leptospira gomenensis TaxID=2484974 RepID=A0A5F1YLP5_9LEPT|nr:glutathione S-transferase family protein [Leptospira gomenensis]TGK41990.1 glutathione S-transferase family protein [Leptospira gomenensis]TGK44223.1 glutathione S-transferase family protein [Leptospira gomenensis]TGK58008.1 glutathione S-transferase family protein [Leptospira gomenensis]
MRKYTVYGTTLSGNCHKVKTLLELLGWSYLWIEVDTRKGETKTEEFLKLNPNGKIPVLELEDKTRIPESNAILYYLARDTDFFSRDLLEQTRILEWMFFEQYSHEPYIAVNRWLLKYAKTENETSPLISANREKGNKALSVMETHLRNRSYFVGERLTIADICLYAYTHVAEEGGFSFDDFPNVRKWLRNVAAYPKLISIRE